MPRRIISFVACLLTLALLISAFAACFKSNKFGDYEEPITSQFSCNFTADYKNMTVKGRVERSSSGTLKMTLYEPETVKGICLEWINDKIKVNMNGIIFEVDPDKIPESALGTAILTSLDSSVGAAEASITKATADGTVMSGTTSLGEYTMVFNPETGFIESLEIPSLPLSATFSDFQVESIEVLTPPTIPN